MRTDTLLIESYLDQTINAADAKNLEVLKSTDPGFKDNLISQAKVHLAAILYGRIRRRSEILKAAEIAFSDRHFKQHVTTIFK
jgi:hypothetical protein